VETSGLVYDYSTNRVGIGTASPSGKLSIGSAAGEDAYFFFDNDDVGDTTDGQRLRIYRRAAEGDTLLSIHNDQYQNSVIRGTTGSGSELQFWNDSGHLSLRTSGAGKEIRFQTESTERMVILSSGNVGIGTTSPYAKLSVVGETVAEYFTATSTTATSTFAGGVNLSTLSGLVGIGTTSPSRKLDVVGADSSAQLRLSQSILNFGEFTIDSVGDLKLSASGGDIRALSENLWICDGAGCPSLTATSSAGNVFVENAVTFGNGFSINEISSTELGLYNASGTLMIMFDQ